MTVVASGTGTLSYQWKKNGGAISGATNASYTIASPQVSDTGSYTVTITNSVGSTTSSAATLTVNAAPTAPAITTQPTSQTVVAGTSVTLTVVASGTAPLSYQWSKGGVALSGATAASYTIAAVTTGDAGSYTCVVTNGAGSATSNAAILTVNAATIAPAITTQPSSVTVTAGATATFTIVASGTGPLSYQWLKSGVVVSGATAASYTIASAQTSNAGNYTCVVTNSAGSATSNPVTLTVNAVTVAPTIATQPTSAIVTAGGTATFTVVATGTAPLSYQWSKDGVAIAGATAAGYTISSVQAGNAGSYWCVVSNSGGSVTSAGASLTVSSAPAAPTIATQPSSVTVTSGSSAIFSVVANGTTPLSYQWYKGGSAIAGATTASYTIAATKTTDAGPYACVVTNSAGSATSNLATLTVNVAVVAPEVVAQPVSATVSAGGNATLRVTATVTSDSPAATYQWQRNGSNVVGATSTALTINNVQPDSAGLYAAVITGLAATTTDAAIVGVSTTNKVIGSGQEVSPNITLASNGFTYDQVLLQGTAATVTADAGQIVRISYLDLTDDIVQVEFSGAGTLSLVLDSSSGPALPANYNQSVAYMKGHAGIVITGADETSNVSVFSVGRVTAVNQALFKDSVTYDGVADIAFIAISSSNGKFGGLRTANVSYFATKGLTGVYAPGVIFDGPVFIGDVNAWDAATPVIRLGSASDTRINGGDLLQSNGRAVQVSGITRLKFVANTDSHGNPQAAKTNQAVLQQNGVDVTSQIVVNPGP